jgi:hypothetical protein
VLKQTDVVGDAFKWIVKGCRHLVEWEKRENVGKKNLGVEENANRGKLLNEQSRGSSESNGIYCEDSCAIKVTSDFQPSTPKMGAAPRGHSIAAVDIKHTLHVTIEFENINRGGIVPDELKFSSNIIVAGVGRRECLSLLDCSPHLVPTLSYESVAGNETWIPEYLPRDGRRVREVVDPIRDPPGYSAAVDTEEELSESDEEELTKESSGSEEVDQIIDEEDNSEGSAISLNTFLASLSYIAK